MCCIHRLNSQPKVDVSLITTNCYDYINHNIPITNHTSFHPMLRLKPFHNMRTYIWLSEHGTDAYRSNMLKALQAICRRQVLNIHRGQQEIWEHMFVEKYRVNGSISSWQPTGKMLRQWKHSQASSTGLQSPIHTMSNLSCYLILTSSSTMSKLYPLCSNLLAAAMRRPLSLLILPSIHI
jgi:hypothetical protein